MIVDLDQCVLRTNVICVFVEMSETGSKHFGSCVSMV